jgi:hypothetical protein
MPLPNPETSSEGRLFHRPPGSGWTRRPWGGRVDPAGKRRESAGDPVLEFQRAKASSCWFRTRAESLSKSMRIGAQKCEDGLALVLCKCASSACRLVLTADGRGL